MTVDSKGYFGTGYDGANKLNDFWEYDPTANNWTQKADFPGTARYDAVAFGCPAMGAEVLEEDEFAPMFESCESKLSGKKIALFGSYGWGDGEWMRNWEESCISDGAVMACDFVICNEAPDDDAIAACKALGKALV